MLASSKATSSFAVDDLAPARRFYEETLGLAANVVDEENGVMILKLAGDREAIVYAKPDFAPATYTVLNFAVDDIDEAVEKLTARGVELERYENMPQDEKGVMREAGPPIAWFTDPAGNIFSVIQE